jgi:hypothetical protein
VAAQRLKDISAGARRYLRRGALVIPFLVGPFALRLAIGPISSALAAAMMAVAPAAPPSVAEPDLLDESDRAPAHDGHGENLGGDGRRRIARRSVGPRVPGVHSASDGGKPAVSPPVDAAPKGTIVVPATAVAKAIERKDVGARDARGQDGKPLGARIHGVSRYHTGLLDGDIVISVGGVRTETTDAMVDAATKSLGAGATKLSGRILRGEDVWTVVLELPPR